MTENKSWHWKLTEFHWSIGEELADPTSREKFEARLTYALIFVLLMPIVLLITFFRRRF